MIDAKIAIAYLRGIKIQYLGVSVGHENEWVDISDYETPLDLNNIDEDCEYRIKPNEYIKYIKAANTHNTVLFTNCEPQNANLKLTFNNQNVLIKAVCT